MTEVVTGYVARRLIEREKALASDALFGAKPRPASTTAAPATSWTTSSTPSPTTSSAAGRLRATAVALFDLVESIILVLIVVAVLWFVWRFAMAWKAGAL
jgi:hypothetical protein